MPSKGEPIPIGEVILHFFFDKVMPLCRLRIFENAATAECWHPCGALVYFHLSKKIRLDISCESSAAVVIGTLKVKALANLQEVMLLHVFADILS